MNYEEAKQELNDITEIHRKSWDGRFRLFIDSNDIIRIRMQGESPGELGVYNSIDDDLTCDDWEIIGTVSTGHIFIEDSSSNPVIMTIHTTVSAGMEPMAQLISVLFDTLNNSAFDDLSLSVKARALRFIADGYN